MAEVARLTELAGGDESQIAAAWLHDTVEDTDTTLVDIYREFGAEVSRLVNGLTDPPEFEGQPLLQRKAQQAERVLEKDERIQLVKMADQIANVGTLGEDPPMRWDHRKCIEYAVGAMRIVDVCRNASEILYKEFRKVYKEALKAHIVATPPK